MAGGLALTLNLIADPQSPGYVDLGAFSPPANGRQSVDVHLKGPLLGMAIRVAETQDPKVAEALRGLESVRVHVEEVSEGNRVELEERIRTLRVRLTSDGWEPIVNVQQDDQQVGVFLKPSGPETIAGVVVTVLAPKEQAVFVNVAGELNPEKIARLGQHFGIEPLKKLGQEAAPK